MSQPSGPQRLTLPAGGHGRPAVHAAPGEGGADGRGSGPQRPPRGAARRGGVLSLSPCVIALVFMFKDELQKIKIFTARDYHLIFTFSPIRCISGSFGQLPCF